MSDLRTVIAPNAGPFTLDGTRTYVVGRERPAIIDPGPDADAHQRRVADEVSDATVATLLLTHDHSDHAGGAERLSRLLAAPVRDAGSGHDGIRTGSDPAGARVGPADPRVDVDPGDVIPTDSGELVAVSTPGHAAPHLAFHWPDGSAVFVGDLVLGQGTTTWVGAYPGCVADYLESLDRIDALDAEVLYPGHGAPIFEVSRVVDRFRRHRLRRLDQLWGLREAEPDASADALARKLYGTLEGEGLHRAALESVKVMLHHLETERGV